MRSSEWVLEPRARTQSASVENANDAAAVNKKVSVVSCSGWQRRGELGLVVTGLIPVRTYERFGKGDTFM